jgi:Ca2+/Na+ antiporter
MQEVAAQFLLQTKSIYLRYRNGSFFLHLSIGNILSKFSTIEFPARSKKSSKNFILEVDVGASNHNLNRVPPSRSTPNSRTRGHHSEQNKRLGNSDKHLNRQAAPGLAIRHGRHPNNTSKSVNMKLQFLSLLFTAWAIIIHSQLFVQASPVEQLISPTGISAALSTTTVPYSQKTSLVASVPTTNFTESSIQATNNHSTAHLFDNDSPPQSAAPDNHTKLKIALLFFVFVVVLLMVLGCYCAWKHKAGIAKVAMMAI